MSADPAVENLAAWRRWLEAALPGRNHDELLALVEKAVAAGLQSDEIAALLRAKAGITTVLEQMALARARAGLGTSLARLRTAPAGETRAEVEAGWAEMLNDVEASLQPQTPGLAARAAFPVSPGPAFNWRQFLSEHAIQLLGFAGAFLLGIAVLLFDLSGQTPSRFFALAALDLALFGAAYAASRIPALRVLFRAYTAMAALALPLTLLAAYVFLDLREQITVLTGLSAGGLICAVTYGFLARAVSEPAYAWVSLGAFGAAVFCGTDQISGGHSAGGAALAAVGLLLVAARDRAPALFREPAGWLGLLAPAAGAVAAFLPDDMANAPNASWALSAALALTSATYGLRVAQRHRPRLEWLAPWAVTATALSVVWIWSPTHAAVQFSLLALATGNLALGRLRTRLRWWEEGLGAALLVSAVLLSSGAARPQAVFFLTAVVLAAAGAWRWRSVLWSFYAAALLAIGWYWFGSAVLPPPPKPGPDDLARLYAGLPVLFYVAGLLLRGPRPQLRLAMFAGFGATTLFATGTAAGAGDDTLGGAVLLTCSALGYALTLLELPPLAPAPLVGMIAGSLLLLGAHTSEVRHALLLVGAWALAIRTAAHYLARSGRPGWAVPQRYTGLALAAAAGAGAAALAWTSADSWALAELAIVQLGAAAAFTLDWRAGERLSFYVAWTAVASVAIPLASALRLADGQFRVAPLGLALLLLGVRAATDGELAQPRATARWLQAGGLVVLLGFTSGQIAAGWGGSSQAGYTAWLATEAVLALALAIGVSSRWPALAGSGGLVLAAVSAISLLATRLPLSAVFGILAAVLIVGATALALLRGRLHGGGRSLDWAAWL